MITLLDKIEGKISKKKRILYSKLKLWNNRLEDNYKIKEIRSYNYRNSRNKNRLLKGLDKKQGYSKS